MSYPISSLRKIYPEIKKILPHGKNTLKMEINKIAEKPQYMNEKADFMIDELKSHYGDKVTQILKQLANTLAITKDPIHENFMGKLLNKVIKEEGELCQQKADGALKNLGTKITNKSASKNISFISMDTCSGIAKLKKYGFKTPKNVTIGDYKDRFGFYNKLLKNTIFLAGDAREQVVLHESIHLNHLKGYINSILQAVKTLTPHNFKLFLENKNVIKKEISDYATTNTHEFVAETGAKLFENNWDWSKFNPKIKELYKLFNGPLPKNVI